MFCATWPPKYFRDLQPVYILPRRKFGLGRREPKKLPAVFFIITMVEAIVVAVAMVRPANIVLVMDASALAPPNGPDNQNPSAPMPFGHLQTDPT